MVWYNRVGSGRIWYGMVLYVMAWWLWRALTRYEDVVV